MDLIKLFLAYICYYVGDFFFKFDSMWWFYNKFMIWSCELDVNNKLWKENAQTQPRDHDAK